MLKIYALKLTGNDEDAANDLVQETVLRALSAVDRCHSTAHFKAWMFTIMRNIFLNELKRAAKFVVVDDIIKAASDNFTTYVDAVDDVSAKEIEAVIDSFSKEHRDAIRLFVLGYRYREIAELLSVPVGTVKSRLFFIRHLLKRKINS